MPVARQGQEVALASPTFVMDTAGQAEPLEKLHRPIDGGLTQRAVMTPSCGEKLLNSQGLLPSRQGPYHRSSRRGEPNTVLPQPLMDQLISFKPDPHHHPAS